ncbi:MAG: hypothetical protein ACJ74W_16665 [Pyrinomonadaceae bacterium]
MSTSSTKSRDRKAQGPKARSTTTLAPANVEPAHTAGQLSPRTWQLASFAIIVSATLLRIYHLELNPFHHDEGVNGFFLLNLMRSGVYHYDPANYHGPTLYYFALPLAYPLDHFHLLSTWSLRAVTAAFGVGLVWLTLALRRYIGAVGALAAAALLAVSPGMVYNSRYFIHELLFVLFTLGIVVAALRFYEGAAQPQTPARPYLNEHAAGIIAASAGIALVVVTYMMAHAATTPLFSWPLLTLMLFSLAVTIWTLWAYDGPRATYLLLAAVSAGLLFATKETAFISAGTLVLAALSAWFYVWLGKQVRRSAAPARKQAQRGRGKAGQTTHISAWQAFIARSGGWPHLVPLVVVALCIFLFVNLVYYSSFFTNPHGVYDGFYVTFQKWTETGKSGFHQHSRITYLDWLWQEEAPLMLLGACGTLVAVVRARSRFAVFAGAWACGILLAYSLVPYKTPWLQLNFVLPFAIIGGYAIAWAYNRTRPLALVALAIALAVGLYQTYQLNFVHYDDDSYPYVYAHTTRGYLELLAKIDQLAQNAGTGHDTNINIASPDYWPMPWYLRDYKNVGYLGHLGPTGDALVIVNVNQQTEANALLGENYRPVGSYPLRPGVTLVLYARRDIAN